MLIKNTLGHVITLCVVVFQVIPVRADLFRELDQQATDNKEYAQRCQDNQLKANYQSIRDGALYYATKNEVSRGVSCNSEPGVDRWERIANIGEITTQPCIFGGDILTQWGYRKGAVDPAGRQRINLVRVDKYLNCVVEGDPQSGLDVDESHAIHWVCGKYQGYNPKGLKRECRQVDGR